MVQSNVLNSIVDESVAAGGVEMICRFELSNQMYLTLQVMNL